MASSLCSMMPGVLCSTHCYLGAVGAAFDLLIADGVDLRPLLLKAARGWACGDRQTRQMTALARPRMRLRAIRKMRH
jgi:hypothetical protein